MQKILSIYIISEGILLLGANYSLEPDSKNTRSLQKARSTTSNKPSNLLSILNNFK